MFIRITHFSFPFNSIMMLDEVIDRPASQ